MTGRHHLVETHLSQLGLVLDLPVVIGTQNGAGGHLLAKLVFLRRIAAWVDAARIQTGMDYARHHPADATNPCPGGKLRIDEFAGDELACALTMSPRTAQNELHHTISICERFPHALDALAAGLIDRGMLWMIETLTTGLSDTEARLLAQEVLDLLTDRPFTTAQMRYRLKKRVEQIRSLHDNDEDREGEEQARTRSRKARTVALRHSGDGNTELVAVLGAYDAATAWKVINTAAWQVKTIGDQRGIGEIRAAVVLDLILGRIPNGHEGCGPSSESSQPNQSSESSDSDHEAGDSTGDSAAGDSTTDGTTDSAGKTAGASAPNSADAPSQDHSDKGKGQEAGKAGGRGRRGPNRRPAAGGCAACGCTRATTRGGGGGLKSIRASNLKAIVNVTIPLTEFLLHARKHTSDPHQPGADETGPAAEESERQQGSLPGEISGVGTLAGWVVRDAVNDLITTPGTAFRAVMYDDTTGELQGMSSPRYIPPPLLAQHVRHRDMTCRFPGCRQDAQICDTDHCIPWHQGGVTAACNLGALCRKHHRLKQTLGWTVRYEDGVAYWNAPTGHVYRSWTHDWRDPHHPTPHSTAHGTAEKDTPPRTQGPPQGRDPADGQDCGRGTDSLSELERIEWEAHMRGEADGYDRAPSHPDRAVGQPSEADTWLAVRGITPVDPDGPIPF